MNINNIVEIIATEFLIYYFVYKYLGHSINKKFILCPVAVILLTALLEMSNYADIIYFSVCLILYFILPCIIFKSIKYLPVLFGIVGGVSLINVISHFLFSLTECTNLISSLCYICANILLMLFIFLISLNKSIILSFKTLFNNSGKIFIIIDIYIWELVLLLSALVNLFLAYPHAQIATLVSILIVLSMVISFISFFLLISKNMKSIHYQSVNKLVEQNIEEQVNYYNRLSQYNDDLRKFKHDYENLKIGLLAQLKEGNIDEAIKILNDCSSMISTSDLLYHTGSPVIDSLLFDKANQVKDSNITINFNGLFPQNPMNTADLCAVFGNIIDNAIEACLKLPKADNKNIEIFLSQKHDYIFITFINPVLDTVEIRDNAVATTKENKKEHGIGLYSVRKILKKYDGHLSLNSDDKVFTTKIDFQIRQ